MKTDLSKIKIEKGIPMPKMYKDTGKQIRVEYPLDDMEVNNSFLVKATKKEVQSKLMIVRAYFRTYKRRFGNKKLFTCSIVKGGVRVWRIK